MKKQFRTAMLSSICLLIVGVLSLTGVTYAWFSAGTDATIEGMDVTVTTSEGGIEVWDATNSKWASKITMSTGLTNVSPVSTANGVNFFTGTINEEDSNQIVTAASTTSNYYTNTLRIRNTGAEDLDINMAGSTITAKTWEEGDTFKDNAIFKAARIYIKYTKPAADEDSEDEVIEYFFAPHDDGTTYYGVKAASKGNGTDGADVYFDINTENATYTTAITPVGADECIISLPASGEVVEVYIAVWVEGQDPDCNNNTANGAFDILLQFTKAE